MVAGSSGRQSGVIGQLSCRLMVLVTTFIVSAAQPVSVSNTRNRRRDKLSFYCPVIFVYFSC